MSTAARRFPAEMAGEEPKRTPLGKVILDRPATLADLDRLPPTWRGEVLRGTMYAFPRPRSWHQRAGGTLFHDLMDPFDRGRGGPGGWWILVEPGVQLPGEGEFSPDIAGWRRERLPHLPEKGAISIIPDWVCEVFSPRTSQYDQVVKRRYYADLAIPYLWYVDPIAKTLLALKLEAGRWMELGMWENDSKVRVEPFDAVELSLCALWDVGHDEPEAREKKEDPSPVPPSSTI